MLAIAEILGEDAKTAVAVSTADIQKQLEASLQAMKDNYYRKEPGSRQGGGAFLADLGIADAADLAALDAKYAAEAAFDTGIFGTYILIQVLLKHGFADTAYALLTSEKENLSFGHMKNCGATTIWEDWNGGNSHDHPMFGAVTECLFTGFLGIQMEEAGWKKLRIAPQIPAAVRYMEGSLETAAGRISVSYDADREQNYIVTVPDAAVFVLNGKEYLLTEGENRF